MGSAKMTFICDKHGLILCGDTCINCEREREQITPKITPPTPRFSPRHIDSIHGGGAFAMAMTIMAIKPDAQTEGFLKWRKACESAAIEGFCAVRAQEGIKKISDGLQQAADQSLLALLFGPAPDAGAQSAPPGAVSVDELRRQIDAVMEESRLMEPKPMITNFMGLDLAKGPSVTVKSIAGLRVET